MSSQRPFPMWGEVVRRDLNMMKNLTEIKTWGGRRAGAGRPKAAFSQRAFCEEQGISPYILRQARRIGEFDKEHGTHLLKRCEAGRLRFRDAFLIMALVTVWVAEGKCDWSAADKIK